MGIALVTGSSGLVGSEAVRHFAADHDLVIGIDNDMRAEFFGNDASTAWVRDDLLATVPNFRHETIDIRDHEAVFALFSRYGSEIDLIIHTAAQPSHDWAASAPAVDFGVNAQGTLTMLEACRCHSPDAVFIFTSTNKVYGDRPNSLPLVEEETRWEIAPDHDYREWGIPEEMSVDMTTHSLFGVSKLAADQLVQEYGRYFGLRTGAFRAGCITGPSHSGAKLHGFLAYLMRCTATGEPYTVFGYKAKQVRDNIHSADLLAAFRAFADDPDPGAVYNIGGGRASNCSMLEAIDLCEQISGHELDWTSVDDARIGDHIWWISDTRKFQDRYPQWHIAIDVPTILKEIHDSGLDRW